MTRVLIPESTEYSKIQLKYNKSGSFRMMSEKFFKACDEVLDDFLEKMSDLSWQRKGIFFTEALAFIAMCKMNNINTIIESGVRNGDSTEIWLKYFGDNIKLYSVDLMKHGDDVGAAINRLSHYKNLEFKQGDGEKVVPGIVHILPQDARVGILLDGPKEFGAMRISRRCFAASDRVKFTAIHDMGDGALRVSSKPSTVSSISQLRMWENYIFNTDDIEFRKKYAYVDDKLGGENNEEWKEYKKKYPTGCGLAFLQNDHWRNR